jgi:glycosyltransferase A (GT-A) superfamily protein (DUF2064 family)
VNTDTRPESAILIVAKAPVPGLAKTRLAPVFGDDGAAELAAAALLDTLHAARGVTGTRVLVAWHGEIGAARRHTEIATELRGCEVFTQSGTSFADRLVHAHHTAATMGVRRVLQIGMDTPQLDSDTLSEAMCMVNSTPEKTCLLGPAADGGWWGLGLPDLSSARCLRGVPMSRPDTAERTIEALCGVGCRVELLACAHDVDLPSDVHVVAQTCSPTSHFARSAAATRTPARCR